MPLTDEQKAAVQLLASADAEEAAEALKDQANPIYNRVFGAGVTTGKGQVQSKLDGAKAEAQAAADRLTELESELAELKEKTPDRATIDAQWQARLEREKQAIQGQLDAANQRVARLTTETVEERAENALLAAGFRPRIAKLLAREHKDRIRFDDAGQPVLYDGETPVQAPAGRSVYEVIAEQEKQAADPADLISNADTGGGSGRGGAASKRTDEEYRQATEATADYTL